MVGPSKFEIKKGTICGVKSKRGGREKRVKRLKIRREENRLLPREMQNSARISIPDTMHNTYNIILQVMMVSMNTMIYNN